jgi:hypothetical protein
MVMDGFEDIMVWLEIEVSLRYLLRLRADCWTRHFLRLTANL